ncbi:MAG: hypothetical protein KAT79_05540 [candidate division Zixibacteria bacterium]|nr:hypothetical protein [candidate division Zixibacteria bacterium]
MPFSIPEPSAKRSTVIVAAGVVWLAAGLFMIASGAARLTEAKTSPFLPIALGLFLGLLKRRFVLGRMAVANIARIRNLAPHKERICLFAFQAFQSYVVVIVMVTLGIVLRNSAIPNEWRATILLAIGTSLALASSTYFAARKTG